MKKIYALLIIFAIFSALSTACAILPQPVPSATPSPSHTPIPTETSTPIPTKTFTPIPTNTHQPTNTPTQEPSSTSEPVQTSNGCLISTDSTYGYTEENPIRVGGDFMDGPKRERAYLDNLLGPNGEGVSYVRNGSIPSGDVILDIYGVTVAGKTLTLYIDMYGFTEPQAPVGFTCVGAFPLSEP